MNNDELQQHVASTYRNLRMGLVVISFAFPLFLWSVGWFWYGIPLQNSMSAYYFAKSPNEGAVRSLVTDINIAPIRSLVFTLAELDNEAPMRSWFVGILFVLGSLLYLYKGFSQGENILLNVAGLCAVGVALFPMEWNCDNHCRLLTVHGILAIITFLCMAVVAVYYSKQTLMLPLDEHKRQIYKNWYTATAICMVIFPVLAFVITQITQDGARLIFMTEWLGIWSFATYWWVKSRELRENRAEIRAIQKDPALSAAPPP